MPPLDGPKGRSVESALASESVQLLLDRAQSVRADFEVNEANAEYVVELIERLDGLPLAIELVTSRLRQFSVQTILQRLDSRMLAAGSVDLPERQRTIEATIAWSHDLLDPPVRDLSLACRCSPGAPGSRSWSASFPTLATTSISSTFGRADRPKPRHQGLRGEWRALSKGDRRRSPPRRRLIGDTQWRDYRQPTETRNQRFSMLHRPIPLKLVALECWVLSLHR